MKRSEPNSPKLSRQVTVFLLLTIVFIVPSVVLFSTTTGKAFLEDLHNFHLSMEKSEENILLQNDDDSFDHPPPLQDERDLQQNEKMNIVFLYGDDWRFDSLGYVNPQVHTPNLDRLAKEGMLFTENAVTTSICWISRACLATGQHYARHETLQLGEPVPFYEYWNETLYGKLTEHNYFTGAVGKWQPGGLQGHMFNVSTNYWGFHFDDSGNHITDMNERDALDFLRKKRKNVNDPFALFVNFFSPHHWDGNPEQYLPQNKTKHLYQDGNITFGPTCTDEYWKKLPPFFNDYNDGRSRWRDRFDEPNKAQKMIKNYYRLISGVDMTCGKILDELDRQNLTDSTLIIFTTDNGYYHSEHGLADKWYAHQESIKVPLIIKDPRMRRDLIGTKNDEFTLSIDLAPTMLTAAGSNIPKRMQGRDMSILYTEESKKRTKQKWRRKWYYEYPGIPGNTGHIPVQALVRKDYKYIYWPTQNYTELFHLPTDHYEINDLARNNTHIDILEKLRKQFLKAQSRAK